MSAVSPNLSAFGVVVPDGWTLEVLPRQPDYALLGVPAGRYMATLDFGRRGIRTGYSTSGRLLGEEWDKPRKKYVGRGWRQALVDDAVAHLQALVEAAAARLQEVLR